MQYFVCLNLLLCCISIQIPLPLHSWLLLISLQVHSPSKCNTTCSVQGSVQGIFLTICGYNVPISYFTERDECTYWIQVYCSGIDCLQNWLMHGLQLCITVNVIIIQF